MNFAAKRKKFFLRTRKGKPVLVDTSVLSVLLSKNRERKLKVAEFLQSIPRISTSVVVIYEIEYGLRKAKSERSLAGFREMIKSLGVEVFPVTEEIAKLAAEKRAEAGTNGRTLHTEDLFIGATAAKIGASIATENQKDFEIWGVELISPLSATEIEK